MPPKAKPPKAKRALSSITFQGLVLGLPMDEGGGAVAHDISGFGHDGTLNGALKWQGGQSGYCVGGFAGGSATTTTYINCGNASDPNLATQAGATWAAWIFPTAISGNHFVIGKDDDVAGRDYAFGINSSGQILIQIAGNPLTLSTAGVPLNQWSHIAVAAGFFVKYGTPNGTYAGYINGAFQASSGDWATLRPVTVTANVNIGRRSFSGFNDGFIGAIDFPTIFANGLTADQVSQLSHNTFAMVTNPRQVKIKPAPVSPSFKGGGADLGAPYGLTWLRMRRVRRMR